MTVSVPLFADLLKKRMTPADMQAFYAEHYGDSRVVKVRPWLQRKYDRCQQYGRSG